MAIFSIISLYTLNTDKGQLQNLYATSNSTLVTNTNNTISNSGQIANSNIPDTQSAAKNNTNMQQLSDFSSSIPLTNTTVHSQSLTVTKASMRATSDFLSTKSIAGTIVNNSPETIDNIRVYAALFDKNNDLVDIASGTVDFSILKPQEDTSFKVGFYEDNNIQVSKYMLFVVGTPTSG